jgi:hypothetical protein
MVLTTSLSKEIVVNHKKTFLVAVISLQTSPLNDMFRKFGYDGTVVSMTHFSRGMFNVSNVDI